MPANERDDLIAMLVKGLRESGQPAARGLYETMRAHDVRLLLSLPLFCERAAKIKLRSYQLEPAEAIAESALRGYGLSFVVLFPRQSGKNELQAQIEAYLLARLCATDAEIVKISPTWKPQSLNAMRRLQRTLERNALLKHLWQKEAGYIYRVGSARIFFLSGSPEANIVGATASTLLEVDEAQDVQIAKFDRDILPMAASANATRVFWGTAWTSSTLLARELRAARQAQENDGVRRAFVLSAAEVAAEVPAYGKFVEEQTRRLGRSHPMVRTQYFSEEMDAEGGMFPPARAALMRGGHRASPAPGPGCVYAFLLDVAGMDEAAADGLNAPASPGRDATALTIVQVDLSTLSDETLKAPTYRVQARRLWSGLRHTHIYAQVRALADTWTPRWIVVDATGVGAGLCSFLEKAFPGRVIPFVFTQSSKSRLGWEYLAIVDTGRWQEALDADTLQETFWRQAQGCQYTVLEGPGKLMRWGVPDGARDPQDGSPLHDDLLVSAALCAALDGQDWFVPAAAQLIAAPDPLDEIDRGY